MSTVQLNRVFWVFILLLWVAAFGLGLRPDASAQAPAKAQRWEYKVTLLADLAPDPGIKGFTAAMNRLGDEGWQYDGTPAAGIVIFKRPK